MVHLECKPDEALVKFLGIPRKEICHHNDKFRVIKNLKKSVGQIGIIDEDPNSIRETYFNEIKLVSENDMFDQYLDTTRKHKIIVLKPRLEGFLINSFKANNIDFLKEMGFRNENNLHNGITSKLERLKKVLTKYHDRIPEINELKNAITT